MGRGSVGRALLLVSIAACFLLAAGFEASYGLHHNPLLVRNVNANVCYGSFCRRDHHYDSGQYAGPQEHCDTEHDPQCAGSGQYSATQEHCDPHQDPGCTGNDPYAVATPPSQEHCDPQYNHNCAGGDDYDQQPEYHDEEPANHCHYHEDGDCKDDYNDDHDDIEDVDDNNLVAAPPPPPLVSQEAEPEETPGNCDSLDNPYCAGDERFAGICCPPPNVCYFQDRQGTPGCCPAGQICETNPEEPVPIIESKAFSLLRKRAGFVAGHSSELVNGNTMVHIGNVYGSARPDRQRSWQNLMQAVGHIRENSAVLMACLTVITWQIMI